MPKQEGQKSKLLALLRIFEQQTDENHLLNVPQLVELLETQGIRCERKSVYSDIEALGALGYDIKLRRGLGGGYFLASRTFDLAELKLLVDAVQASRVVSGTTSRRLIHKLEKLCSNYEGSQLQRQVYVEGRPKTDSKSLLYSIDALHEAINNGKMVEFLYRKADSREKEKRIVSPWQLAWENGCYYLIAFADEKGIRHYRVDKLREPALTELSAQTGWSPEEIAQVDLATEAPDSLQRETADGLALEGLLGTEAPEEGLVERIALREAVDQLPEKERMTILLRYFKGLTQERAARVLGVSQVQVSRLERRGLERLRQSFAE